jgi:hypothetical protein
LEKYFPPYMEAQMELKVLELKQENIIMAEREAKFTELLRFVPKYIGTEMRKTYKDSTREESRMWFREVGKPEWLCPVRCTLPYPIIRHMERGTQERALRGLNASNVER